MASIFYYAFKILLTSVLIVAVSEASKRSSLLGGLFASLPLISIIGMIWLYVDTRDVEKIAALSQSVFWLVLPSLPMFLLLPELLRRGVNFPVSIAVVITVTLAFYGVMLLLLNKIGYAA